jgi:uncharacterized protein YjeT (DUF2065 family)
VADIPLFDLVLAGIGVMLVAEGLLPFFAPGAWRGAFERVLQMNDGQIRFLGLASLFAGVLLLWVLWS